ncbi:7765_t:CDS:2, partial [Cetraspora pellucida]
LTQIGCLSAFPKFKVNPTIVKNYVEQQIILQLGVESVQWISLQMACRWLHKLGFHYKCYKKGYDEDCKIRTYSLLVDEEKEHVWVTHDEFTFHVNDELHA